MTKDKEHEADSHLEKKQYTETAIQKQYELVVSVYQTEAGRFWTRFNIFTAIELAGLLGVLSNLKILTADSSIFRYVMLFFCLLSLLVIIIAIRGILSHRMLLQMIAYVESKSKELLPLVEYTRTLDPLPQYVNYIVAVVISVMFSIAWWFALIYLEVTNFHIVVPK